MELSDSAQSWVVDWIDRHYLIRSAVDGQPANRRGDCLREGVVIRCRQCGEVVTELSNHTASHEIGSSVLPDAM